MFIKIIGARERKKFYISLAFLTIIITLLVAFSIYCYLIKYKAKLFYCRAYVTNNKWIKIYYKNGNKNKLKKYIKNRISYYFDDIMSARDSDSGIFLSDETMYKNILIQGLIHLWVQNYAYLTW